MRLHDELSPPSSTLSFGLPNGDVSRERLKNPSLRDHLPAKHASRIECLADVVWEMGVYRCADRAINAYPNLLSRRCYPQQLMHNLHIVISLVSSQLGTNEILVIGGTKHFVRTDTGPYCKRPVHCSLWLLGRCFPLGAFRMAVAPGHIMASASSSASSRRSGALTTVRAPPLSFLVPTQQLCPVVLLW